MFRIYQSEIFATMDTIFYDVGVTGDTNSHWYNYGNRLSVEVDSEGTLLTSLNSNYGYYYPIKKNDAITDANSYIFDTFELECDIVSSSSLENEIVFYNGVDTASYLNLQYMRIPVTGGHLKIRYDGTTITITPPTGSPLTIDRVYTQKFRLGFDIHPNESLKYKHFKIWNI